MFILNSLLFVAMCAVMIAVIIDGYLFIKDVFSE